MVHKDLKHGHKQSQGLYYLVYCSGTFLGLFCVRDTLGRLKQLFARSCQFWATTHRSVFITIPGSVSWSSFGCNVARMITGAPHSRQSCQQLVHLVNESYGSSSVLTVSGQPFLPTTRTRSLLRVVHPCECHWSVNSCTL